MNTKQQSCEIFVALKLEIVEKVQSTETKMRKGFGAMHLL